MQVLKIIRIKIMLILAFVYLLSHPLYSQNRNYLLHTDAHIQRLKKLVENDERVNSAWDEQLLIAENLTTKDRLKASDCEVLALAYRMTTEEKYAEAIKKILLDYSSRETWEGRDLLNRTPAWTGGLHTSHTAFSIALGFDCIYFDLTPTERKQIAKGIVHVGINPLMNNWLKPETSFQTLDCMGHNWWSACVYMAGFASLAIQNEVPEAKQWAIEISETIDEWVDYNGSVLQNKPRNFDRSGGFYESINYASYGVSQYLLFRLAFENMLPEIKQPALDELQKMTNYFIHTTYYTGNNNTLSVNFGDGNLTVNGNASTVLLWNLGCQDQISNWYLRKVHYSKSKGETLVLHTPVGLILTPDLPELPKDYTPDIKTTHLFADMGWATMRNSWENDATFVAVKSGLTWNHTHADAGSFIVFHNGKYLIIDSGNSSYGNPLYTQYYCQSEAHNVVLFNGEGQDREDPYFGVVNHGSLHNLLDAGDFIYLLANATGPYSHILKRNYRSFLWVGDVMLVVDDLLAREPGQFEWLLHYNGESKRRGHDLSIKDGNAEVLVRPLYPETFPNGGLPHDFPEQMRLEEKLGYEDHHPENRQAYWSISHFEKTARTKFISAITFKTDENRDNLPVIERFDGKNFLGVRITQKGKTTEVYFNLLADGRLKHRNSTIEMNGWQTDAYITALTFNEGADRTKVENIQDLFIAHGSYIRKDGQVLAHALSKYTAFIKDFNGKKHVTFQGQPKAVFRIFSPQKQRAVKVNDSTLEVEYDKELKTIKLAIDDK